MQVRKHVLNHFLSSALVFASWSAPLAAQTTSAAAKAPVQAAAEERDGVHDFDFLFGRWKSRQRRLMHPLSGLNDWVEFEATVEVHPALSGTANVDELKGDAPFGHIEGLTVRTYNPKSHQWSIYWSNQANGVISLPATVGKFNKNSRVEFFDWEELNGRR